MMSVAGRVLIVEDSLAMLYALRAQFEAHGWEVTLARTVDLALEGLEPPPDWVVLDLWLAEGDGEDVLRHVRQRQIASRVAVISAGLDAERLARLAPLKPDLILSKPLSFTDLLERMGSVPPLGDAPTAG